MSFALLAAILDECQNYLGGGGGAVRRSADIVPLHKKGSKHLRENYRPISLTSMICKISEKIVRDRLTSFWQDYNVINKNQFGFLQGRSTVTQLLSTFHDFARSRNSSVATDVVFLDLARLLIVFLMSVYS